MKSSGTGLFHFDNQDQKEKTTTGQITEEFKKSEVH